MPCGYESQEGSGLAAMKRLLQSIGPAIIVAAVVLGPGSILTSSKVGATFGLIGVPVILGAAILMIAMVALSARLGVVYKGSLGDELSSRVGRPVTILIGLVLFTLVALFQSSNNIALIGGLEPLLGTGAFPTALRILILIVFNAFVIVCLYQMRDLYRSIERLMKFFIGLMCLAFVVNLVVALFSSPQFEPVLSNEPQDLLPLLAMIGTTFSVAGAFYQAYLVKEKGWGISEVRQGLWDSILSISILGLITAVILVTAWRVFYGHPEHMVLASVGDVARQLEPLFGPGARVVFSAGILAGGLSSFLVNTMIGGTVLADSLGKGSRLEDRWTIHLTTAALMVGMIVGILSLAKEGSTVLLITIAQALTVLGIPALAAALIYLGTRKELTGDRRIPKPILTLAVIGFMVSLFLAWQTADKVYQRINPPEENLAQSIEPQRGILNGFSKSSFTRQKSMPREASRSWPLAIQACAHLIFDSCPQLRDEPVWPPHFPRNTQKYNVSIQALHQFNELGRWARQHLFQLVFSFKFFGVTDHATLPSLS